MKILQICNKSPFPPKEGGPLAMYNLAMGLIAKGHRVHILAMGTPKFPINNDLIPESFRNETSFEWVLVDTAVKPVPALLNLFSRKSYNVERFKSQDFEDKLKNLLQKKKFDIVQLESVFVTSYLPVIRKYSDATVIIRSHNIEHQIWEGIAANTNNPVLQKYIRLLASRLKNYEQWVFNQVDGIVTITNNDAQATVSMGCEKPVTSIPFGILTSDYKPQSYNDFPSLFHIGSMDWLPNIEGIRWFLDKVWQKIQNNQPSLKLYLAGRNMPEWLINSPIPGVVILGEVPDAREFINSKNIMIVPLLTGSGIRVKIIEVMAMGRCIISTSTGASGIDYENGKHLLIADSPEDFYQVVIRCANDKNYCETIGKNARKLIEEKYDILTLSTQLTDFFQKVKELKS